MSDRRCAPPPPLPVCCAGQLAKRQGVSGWAEQRRRAAARVSGFSSSCSPPPGAMSGLAGMDRLQAPVGREPHDHGAQQTGLGKSVKLAAQQPISCGALKHSTPRQTALKRAGRWGRGAVLHDGCEARGAWAGSSGRHRGMGAALLNATLQRNVRPSARSTQELHSSMPTWQSV